MNMRKIIYGIITAVALLFPILFLAKVIDAKIAFPIMYLLLGCQQLYNGLFILTNENKIQRITALLMGVFFWIFGFFVILPMYYL